ncbi:MAG: hypothetical protein M3P18_16015 [Actinomycetota bacterium]|nr:hypothetical protein [Actinomycetota bacterium]
MDIAGATVAHDSGAAAWISAWAAVGTLIVLVVTAVYAIRQFREAKELRRDQTRPYVVPSIGVEQQMMFMLVIENVGKTPAFAVTVAFDPPPVSEIKDLEAVSILKQPIPTMPPAQTFRAFWESALTVFDDENPYQHPMTYKVAVRYSDARGHKYGPENYVLDFHVFEGQAQDPKGVAELVKAVEELTKEHKKWTDGIGGLNVKTTSAMRKARRQDRPSHFRRMRAAYSERGLSAACAYWIGVWRRRHGFWSR